MSIRNQIEGDINLSKHRQIWQANKTTNNQQLLEEDCKYFIHQALSTPCLDHVTHVDGIYLYTSDQQKIMDFHGNSVHQLGYNHPALVNALQKQIANLSFSPRRFTNDSAVALAKKLVALSGGNTRVLFTPSGSASISIALKMVRYAKQKHKTISLWNSFHGANLDTISIGGEGHFRSGIGPLLSGCEHILPYNSYRCPLNDCRQCALKCLDYLEYICACEGDIGAIILEPIRCTDVHIPPADYFIRLRQICDQYDIALIFDEIPTALGRTGTFFAYQNYPIKPDIVVIGKGLGGALYPFSAVIANEEYNVCQTISLGHYTHEKSPLGSAIGLALIETIEQDHILEHVNVIHHAMRKHAAKLQAQFACIGDVRCIGALMAIELVKDMESKQKDCELAEKILYECLSSGLSFKVSQGNVITLAPPLIINEKQLEEAFTILQKAMQKHCQ